jgi:hypothetical protein
METDNNCNKIVAVAYDLCVEATNKTNNNVFYCTYYSSLLKVRCIEILNKPPENK